MQKTTKIILALAGVGVIYYLLTKKKPFKDKELEKLVEDTKKMPELTASNLEMNIVDTGDGFQKADAIWIDDRPTYDSCYPNTIKDGEAIPECQKIFENIRRGFLKVSDVKDLTKEEFEKMSMYDLIMVDDKVMQKGYYIDYILKPSPTKIAEAVQKTLDEQLGLIPPKVVPLPVPVQSPNDPLKAVASAEVISKYDPDRVLERTRLGEDVGYTGVRQPQTISSTTGTAYSEMTKKDGILYGLPIEGAKVTQTITGNDGTLLYQNNYIMTSGVLMPV